MTVAGETHRCPPHEVLAAFVDAKLPRNQVVALTEHLTTCAECRFVVESASELQAEEQEESIAPRGGRAWQQFAVAAVIGAGFLLTPVAAPSVRQWYVRTTTMRELVVDAAKLKKRLIEPRLTGGFGYGEWSVTRSGNDPDAEDNEKALQNLLKQIAERTAGEVLTRTKNDHSPDAAHARGIAALLRRETDRAIAELTTATQKRPNDAQAWNDLAAAYIQKQQYSKAIGATKRAIALDPKLNEAWFNRALAIKGAISTYQVHVTYRWAKASTSQVARQGSSLAETPEQLIRDGKADEVLRMTAGNRSLDAAHARGIAYLAIGDRNAAINELTALTKARPNDALAWSDLAAALLANDDYQKAIDAADRALEIDPKQSEAQFNRVQARLKISNGAIAAWNDYLKHDSTSPWAEEAQRNISNEQSLR